MSRCQRNVQCNWSRSWLDYERCNWSQYPPCVPNAVSVCRPKTKRNIVSLILELKNWNTHQLTARHTSLWGLQGPTDGYIHPCKTQACSIFELSVGLESEYIARVMWHSVQLTMQEGQNNSLTIFPERNIGIDDLRVLPHTVRVEAIHLLRQIMFGLEAVLLHLQSESH